MDPLPFYIVISELKKLLDEVQVDARPSNLELSSVVWNVCRIQNPDSLLEPHLVVVSELKKLLEDQENATNPRNPELSRVVWGACWEKIETAQAQQRRLIGLGD